MNKKTIDDIQLKGKKVLVRCDFNVPLQDGKITDKINIYCNDVVYEAIKEVSKYILPQKLMDAVYTITNFNIS